jgi:hypothetical protein
LEAILPDTEAIPDLAPALDSVEAAFQRLLEAIEGITSEQFAWQPPDSTVSVKSILETVADANNFTHAAVVSKARNLGSLRCIGTASFINAIEAAMAVKVSHRRVLNQIAGITAEQFDRVIGQPSLGETSVRKMLVVMADGYDARAAQISALLRHYGASDK